MGKKSHKKKNTSAHPKEAVKATQCGYEAKFTARGSGMAYKGQRNTHTHTHATFNTGRIMLFAHTHTFLSFHSQVDKEVLATRV